VHQFVEYEQVTKASSHSADVETPAVLQQRRNRNAVTAHPQPFRNFGNASAVFGLAQPVKDRALGVAISTDSCLVAQWRIVPNMWAGLISTNRNSAPPIIRLRIRFGLEKWTTSWG
jgi:hypothetical protein